MNHEALLALISDLYAQLAAAQEQVQLRDERIRQLTSNNPSEPVSEEVV
jgi:hypothetical protein